MNPPLNAAIDADAAYASLLVRDARLDGHLFVGVTSTGVYCRPICRVRTPKRQNCRFFHTPAQAEAATFRPCLKCRPEIAPGPGLAWSVMDASRTLARQAAHWLEAHAGDEADAPAMVALAARLGVSDRHLRRIFAAEHGVTPLQYLQTRRLLLAKQLLTDTAMPVAQVALASGFRSLRRFNAAFAANYRLSPSRLRRAADAGPIDANEGVTIVLGFREPLDRAALMCFLAQRAIPGVEEVDGLRVRRTLRAGVVGEAAGWLEATFVADRSQLRVRYSNSLAASSGALLRAVRRWLDLDADPQASDLALSGLPGNDGLRLPGSLDTFELAIRAVLGQQVTVAGARTLARRVVERFGEPIATPWNALDLGFPSPVTLASAPIEQIARLGIIRTRAAAMTALARDWPELLSLMGAPAAPAALIDRLCAVPGIGPWTAHYIAMRALGWPDAFPPGDVAVLKALGLAKGRAGEREAEERSQAWRPWRAYAVLKLWNSLEKSA